MKTSLFAAVAILLLAAGTLRAHHSYGMFYDLRQTVILKGKVTKLSFAEPHVRITVDTARSGTWEAEWTGPQSLTRQGIDERTIRPGDILEIDGSPALKAESRVVSALREIRRPADGWRWAGSSEMPGPRVID